MRRDVTVIIMPTAVVCVTAGCSESFTAAAADTPDGASGESGADAAVPDSGGGDVEMERGSPGGPVAPTFGALSTIGPAADATAADSGSGGLTLTDDGFEMD